MTTVGLDRGESEAIVLAQRLRSQLIILDDISARRYAQQHQLPLTGTAGVIVAAGCGASRITLSESEVVTFSQFIRCADFDANAFSLSCAVTHSGCSAEPVTGSFAVC